MFFQKLKSIFLSNFSTTQTTRNSKNKGIIKFFNKRKGFGFIKSSQLNKDVFVHVEDLKDKIHKGDTVSFQIEENAKGLKAKNVELVEN